MVEDGNVTVALFKDEFAGNETGTPFEFLGAVFLAVGSDIFLGNAEYHRSYFDQTQAPAHMAQGSCVEYNTKSGRYRP